MLSNVKLIEEVLKLMLDAERVLLKVLTFI